jgi:hypothetical protein
MDKIDDALRARLQRDAKGRVAVIVTLSDPMDERLLEARGLDIAHRFEAIGALSGTIAAGDVPGLAALSQVASVELDSEMHASSG